MAMMRCRSQFNFAIDGVWTHSSRRWSPHSTELQSPDHAGEEDDDDGGEEGDDELAVEEDDHHAGEEDEKEEEEHHTGEDLEDEYEEEVLMIHYQFYTPLNNEMYEDGVIVVEMGLLCVVSSPQTQVRPQIQMHAQIKYNW